LGVCGTARSLQAKIKQTTMARACCYAGIVSGDNEKSQFTAVIFLPFGWGCTYLTTAASGAVRGEETLNLFASQRD
jgi:hypothetical protein